MWTGDYVFLLRQLIMKDFKIRYRNMSLGVFWSLLNPLVMMVIYTYVFSRIFKSAIPHFNVHLLSALIPFNFFTVAWITSTSSLLDNAALIKRIPIRREIIVVSSILSNLTHLVIQLGLLLVFVFAAGLTMNMNWFWLPLVWGLELVFLIGLGLACSAMNLFVRDVRYVVESLALILFWIVPIIYTFDMVPPDLRDLYQYNPIAALVLATHNVILRDQAPTTTLLTKLAGVSVLSLVMGVLIFRRAEPHFYEHL